MNKQNYASIVALSGSTYHYAYHYVPLFLTPLQTMLICFAVQLRKSVAFYAKGELNTNSPRNPDF